MKYPVRATPHSDNSFCFTGNGPENEPVAPGLEITPKGHLDRDAAGTPRAARDLRFCYYYTMSFYYYTRALLLYNGFYILRICVILRIRVIVG